MLIHLSEAARRERGLRNALTRLRQKRFSRSALYLLLAGGFASGLWLGATYVAPLGRVTQQSVMRLRSLASVGRSEPIPTIQIDVKYKHIYTLQQQRMRALEAGEVRPGESDFVPAQITYRASDRKDSAAHVIPIDIKLKSGVTHSLRTDNWAYQLKMKNDDRPFQMKRFSLRTVSDRYWTAWLRTEHLRHEGLLASRSELARSVLNGDRQGLLVAEEAFAKEVLFVQDRPEGVILEYGSSPEDSFIRATHANHINKYSGLKRQRESAIAQLQSFHQNERLASEVFNVEALAKFIAINILWNSDDDLSAPTAYFYYDPIAHKLEPMGSHGNFEVAADPAQTVLQTSPWLDHVLADPIVAEATAKELARISDASYLADLQRIFDHRFNRRRNAALGASTNLTLPEIMPSGTAALSDLALASSESTSQAIPVRLSRQAATTDPFVSNRRTNPVSLKTALSQHPFLVSEIGPNSTRVLKVRAGDWDVAGDLILPQGMSLRIEAGTTLRFEPDAFLIASGPLQFEGSVKEPIVLTAQQRTWGGVEVWQASASASDITSDVSNWQHVKLGKTAGGALFYQSPLNLTHSEISQSRSRDALKLIESVFLVRHCLFSQLPDDAIDTDTANGAIEQSQFIEIGGDAIDISRGLVSVRDVDFARIGDKGLSVGQNAQVAAKDFRVSKAAIAAASVDGGSLRLERAQLSQIRQVGFASSSRRLGFGPSSLTAHEIEFDQVPYEAIAADSSRIQLDQEILEGDPFSTHLLQERESE